MRLTCLISLLLLATGIFCQPVKWEMKLRRSAERQYTLTIYGTIAKGWRVYAATDTALGLEPVTLDWKNTNIRRVGTDTLLINAGKAPRDFKDPLFENKPVKIYTDEILLLQDIRIEGLVPASFRLTIKGFAASEKEFLSLEETRELALEGGIIATGPARLASIDLDHPVAACGDKQDAKSGLLAIFLIGFGGGLLALLTPCIFPMIPVTVGFFTGKAATRKQGIQNAATYGAFILGIYTAASAPFHLLGGINPQLFNTISTNAWLNVFFFVVFIIFALSFFGLFEIRLPSAIGNSVANKTGIFFMALTLVIVSFSCTGIILGSLLVNALSAGGNAWQLTAGMAGFGLALALPFGLFAMFPQWLQKIPKSGGWMDTVKITLAFIELALAIKFLSNADLVEHWGILKREVFIGLWILIALALGGYLLGLFEKKKIVQAPMPVARTGLGIAVLLFAVYLSPGVTATKYAGLELLSGLPPPLSYSIYGSNEVEDGRLEPDVVNDYEKALQLAKQQGKPLLIDFTGWACVNCRRMEEQVWSKPAIRQMIKEHFILVSLYVDDRKQLPDGGTMGEKWATFQSLNFKQVTQPLYVILSKGEQLLTNPVGYTPKEKEYSDWLQCALAADR